jgi:hypothetical protein
MKNKIEKLNREYLSASTEEQSKIKLEELKHFINEDVEKLGMEYLEISRKQLADLKEINVKARLQDISEIISTSYIAKKYFGKSKSWISQRINRHEVNGKPSRFTEEEIQTLNFAINDIGKKLGSFSL